MTPVAVKLISVPTFREPDFRAGLRQIVPEGQPDVDIRAVDVDRVELAYQHGSDRDATSRIFDLQPCDSCKATRLEHKIDDDQVTYLLPVHGLTSDKPSVDYENVHLRLGEAIDTQLDHGKWDKAMAYLVYDPAKIEKAPDSWVEFWLPKEPRQALLGIMVSQDGWRPSFDALHCVENR